MRLPRVTVERREKRSQAPVLRTILKYLCCLVLQEQIKAPTPPYWLDSYWKRVSKASEKSKEWGEREPGQRDAEAKRGNVTKRGRPTPPKGWWDKKNKKKQKKKPASFRYGVMEVLFDLETCSLRRVVGQKPECTRNMTEISLWCRLGKTSHG